jgi:hypothetical protein
MRGARFAAGRFAAGLVFVVLCVGCRASEPAPDSATAHEPAPVAVPERTPDPAPVPPPVPPVPSAPVVPEAERAPVSGPLKSVSWLAGRWQGRSDSLLVEETWTDPGIDRMLATGRVVDVNTGRTVFFEFLRIEARGERLVYIALPRGRGETAFPATIVEKHRLRFENPEHDDPKAIEYRLEEDGTLITRVEGRRVEEQRLRRVR